MGALPILGFGNEPALAENSLSVTSADESINIGSRLELFVDDYLIEKLSDVTQRLHQPVAREVVLTCDALWEGSSSGLFSMVQGEGRYRTYFRGSQMNLKKPNGHAHACYAESTDGVTWRRPELGLVEFEGSTKNSILFQSGVFPGLEQKISAQVLAFFRDENPAAPADARYKALVGVPKDNALFAFASGDGIHWRALQSEPVLTGEVFDSQNVAFWDPVAGVYRTYCRSWSDGPYKGWRGVRTATSADFVHWKAFEPLQYGEEPVLDEHLYTSGAQTYPRAPHLIVAFPMRYIERGWSDSMRALPELSEREARAKVHLRYGTSLTESLFMSSRDGVRFHRWSEAFMRPGPERAGTWQYGHQLLAWHIMETKSSLDPTLTELSIYGQEGGWQVPTVLRRYTLRLDGFVSLSAPMKGGEVVTRPLVFSGKTLQLNFATSAAGSIRVELQTPEGQPIPGYALADAAEVFGDSLARSVTWKNGSDLGALAGKPVRLRFVLQDADLYALQFNA